MDGATTAADCSPSEPGAEEGQGHEASPVSDADAPCELGKNSNSGDLEAQPAPGATETKQGQEHASTAAAADASQVGIEKQENVSSNSDADGSSSGEAAEIINPSDVLAANPLPNQELEANAELAPQDALPATCDQPTDTSSQAAEPLAQAPDVDNRAIPLDDSKPQAAASAHMSDAVIAEDVGFEPPPENSQQHPNLNTDAQALNSATKAGSNHNLADNQSTAQNNASENPKNNTMDRIDGSPASDLENTDSGIPGLREEENAAEQVFKAPPNEDSPNDDYDNKKSVTEKTLRAAPLEQSLENLKKKNPQIDRAAVIEAIKNGLIIRDNLQAVNSSLQTKISEILRKKRADEKNSEYEKSATDNDRRYSKILSNLQNQQNAFEETEKSNEASFSETTTKLQERRCEFERRDAEFRKYKRQIAHSAEHSRTGKPIPLKVIEQIESAEMKKDQNVSAVRLENIKLRNKLKFFEQLIKQKEELAEGLHLIDFEQLKIENQAYNEKIEERNEELMKLRKKITNVVHVLAHSKEKLHFVYRENRELVGQLESLERELSAERDMLPQIKQKRDILRQANVELRQKNGLLLHEKLLRDFEERVDNSDRMEAEINQLEAIYKELQSKLNRQKIKERNTRLLPELLK